MEKVLIICGPTATGKTSFALSVAHDIGGELVSADSRQVYRGMDIGTGKDLENKKTINSLKQTYTYHKKQYDIVPYDVDGIALYLYDVVNPDEPFSVSHYQFLANAVIRSIIQRGKVPILVGGTGLYIRSVTDPFETSSVVPDEELRQKLSDTPLFELQELVKSENVDVWNQMNISDKSNPRRLIRKLEITHAKYTPHKQVKYKKNYLKIGLTALRKDLYSRIDVRVDVRMRQGLLEEISSLLDKGFDWRFPSFDALGYKQWRFWFEKKDTRSEEEKKKIIEVWKYAEHAYARRQMTWFKKDAGIRWFDVSQKDAVDDARNKVLAWYNM